MSNGEHMQWGHKNFRPQMLHVRVDRHVGFCTKLPFTKFGHHVKSGCSVALSGCT